MSQRANDRVRLSVRSKRLVIGCGLGIGLGLGIFKMIGLYHGIISLLLIELQHFSVTTYYTHHWSGDFYSASA